MNMMSIKYSSGYNEKYVYYSGQDQHAGWVFNLQNQPFTGVRLTKKSSLYKLSKEDGENNSKCDFTTNCLIFTPAPDNPIFIRD